MSKEILEEIGQRIRDRRVSMHMTQEKAAELLDISLTHYKNIERGRTAMSLDMLMKVCGRFSLDQTYVLTGKTIGVNPILEMYESLPQEKQQLFDRAMYYLSRLLEG